MHCRWPSNSGANHSRDNIQLQQQGMPPPQMEPSHMMGGCQTIEASELDLKRVVGAGAYGKVRTLSLCCPCIVSLSALTSPALPSPTPLSSRRAPLRCGWPSGLAAR